MDAIWIGLDGQRYGPYPPAQAAAMLADGSVPGDASVWWPPDGPWVPVCELHVETAGEREPVAVGVSASGGAAPAEAPAAAPPQPVTVPPSAATAAPAPHRLLPPAPPHSSRWHRSPRHERAKLVGGERETPNAWAFTGLAVGIAALAISWIPVLTQVALWFAAVGAVLSLAALVIVARGAPGRGMALSGLVIAAVAVVVALTVAEVFGSAPQDEPAPVEAASPVRVILGEATPTRATTVLRAQLFNSGAEQIDAGMFTVEAALNGNVLGQSTQAVPAMEPGASATARVVFLDQMPGGTQYRVVKVTTLP